MKYWTIIFFVWLITIIEAQDTDKAILSIFYQSTKGSNWRTVKWNFAANLCANPAQTGVTCNGQNRVTRISLSNQNLDGTLPTEIGLLTELIELTLVGHPKLVGTLPTEIGNWKSVNIIDITTSGLTGDIPFTIGNLTKLTKFRITASKMAGTIPTEIGLIGSTSLTELYLHANPLTGTIPTQIGKLTRLQEFFLYQTQISGTIPTEIGFITTLGSIMMFENNLQGTIPSEISNLTQLYSIRLNDNKITGPLPAKSFIPSKLLRLFYFERNNLGTTIPTEFGLVTSLESFRLAENKLIGTIPSELGNLVNLKEFYFFNNFLTGPIPPQLSGMSKIERFWVQSNLLEKIPDFSSWTQLIDFKADHNSLFDEFPSFFTKLPNLNRIQIEFNQLYGTLPTWNQPRPNFQTLTASNNRLSGDIPEKLPVNLQALDLSYNYLTGTLPSTLGSTSTLRQLSVGANFLSGTIPTEFYSLTSLTRFHLFNNTFTGDVSPKLLQVPTMNNLRLTLNCFSSVPDYSSVPFNDYKIYTLADTCKLSKYSKAGLDDNAIAQWRFDSDPLGFDHAGNYTLSFQSTLSNEDYVRVDFSPNKALVTPSTRINAYTTTPISFPSEFTVEVLFEFKSLKVTSIPIIFSRNSDSTSRAFYLQVLPNGKIEIYSFAILIGSSWENSIEVGETTHLVITKHQNNGIYVYVNGRVVIQSFFNAFKNNFHPFPQYISIGSKSAAFFDEVTIYKKHLLSHQIVAHLETLEWCITNSCPTPCYATKNTIERCEILPDQRIALEELFVNTLGPKWKSPSWDLRQDLCKSFNFNNQNAVRCDDYGNVLAVILQGRDLTGKLLDSMKNLNNARQINLSKNKLSGTIPSLNFIASLQTLLLADNLFTCPIKDYSSWASNNDYNQASC